MSKIHNQFDEVIDEIAKSTSSLCNSVGCASGIGCIGFCCNRHYCEMALDSFVKEHCVADENYKENKRHPYFHGGKCNATPHHRVLCAVHICQRVEKSLSEQQQLEYEFMRYMVGNELEQRECINE